MALFIKLQMISFSYLTIHFFFFKLLHLVLRDLSIAFEVVQYLYLNHIILREATDVFFSFAIFLISHQFRLVNACRNQTAKPCLSGKCMKSKPREGKNTMVGVMIKVALKIYRNQRNAQKLQHFPLIWIDSD